MKTTKRIFVILTILLIIAEVYIAYCYFNAPQFLFGRLIIGLPEIVICLALSLICNWIWDFCDWRLHGNKLAEKDKEISDLKHDSGLLDSDNKHLKVRVENAEKKCRELEGMVKDCDKAIVEKKKEIESLKSTINTMYNDLEAKEHKLGDYYSQWESVRTFLVTHSEVTNYKQLENTPQQVLSFLHKCMANLIIRKRKPELKPKKKLSIRKKQRA